jgi:alpha-tubulin suppressor-like RCC1 family protein
MRCLARRTYIAVPVVLAACTDSTSPPARARGATPHAMAISVAPLSFRQVSAGTEHACGVTTDNVAYCWGAGSLGQVGNGTTSDVNPSPVAVASPAL